MLRAGWKMLMPRDLACGLAAFALLPVWAEEGLPQRAPVTQFAPLLRAALDAPGGTAHGVLAGLVAAAFKRQFGTGGEIDIDVSTIVRYAQPGCARLRVDVSQEGVKLSAQAAPQRQQVRFELNYCSDGLPPRSLATGAAR